MPAGYHQSTQGSECEKCASQSTSIGGTIGFSILIVAAISVVFYVIWRTENVIIPKFSPWKTIKNFTAEDRSSPNFTYNLKILLSFLQIATSLMSFVTIPWPTYFQTFVNYFEFVNLSFIPWSSVECVTTLTFYDKLVLIAAVPIVALLFVAIVPLIILTVQNRMDMNGKRRGAV